MEQYQYSFSVFENSTENKLIKPLIAFILCCLCLVFLLILTFLNTKYTYYYITSIIGIFLFLAYHLFKNKKSLNFKKGKFTGYLTFTENYIQVNDLLFIISDIKEIVIENPDFLYKHQPESFFKPYLSIGIENNIEITDKKNAKHLFKFQQKFDNEIIRVENLLEEYLKKGILKEENLIKIRTNPFL